MTAVLLYEPAIGERDPLTALLVEEGFEVDRADSTTEAVQRAPGHAVVLVDLAYAELDTIRRLATLTPSPSVIALTPFDSPALGLAALREGAVAYLTKPLRVEELFVLVARGVERYELSLELEKLRPAHAFVRS